MVDSSIGRRVIFKGGSFEAEDEEGLLSPIAFRSDCLLSKTGELGVRSRCESSGGELGGAPDSSIVR